SPRGAPRGTKSSPIVSIRRCMCAMGLLSPRETVRTLTLAATGAVASINSTENLQPPPFSVMTSSHSNVEPSTLSDSYFRILVEGVRDYAIFFLDPQGVVRSWNEGAARLTGYIASDIIGRPFSSLFTPADVAAGVPEREMVAALRDGRAEHAGWR